MSDGHWPRAQAAAENIHESKHVRAEALVAVRSTRLLGHSLQTAGQRLLKRNTCDKIMRMWIGYTSERQEHHILTSELLRDKASEFANFGSPHRI